MRHRRKRGKLSRTTEHRRATLRNLARSLFLHERITTTVEKAKALRPFAERLITRARHDSVHARRIVARDLQDRDVVKLLFDEIAVRFTERPGGYTRVLKLGPRRGDNAEMAIIELVERRKEEASGDKSPRKEKKAEKASESTEEAASS